MFQCKCGRTCKSKGGLTLHQKKCSSIVEDVKKEVFTCSTCKKEYKTKRGLENHVCKFKKSAANDHVNIKMPTTSAIKYKNNMLQQAYDLFNQSVFGGQLPTIPLTFCYNMIKKAGLTKMKYKFETTTKKIIPNTITTKILISSVACGTQTYINNTLLHEMCHVAVLWIDQVIDEDLHGPTWHKWVEKAYTTHPEFGEITVTVRRPFNWTYMYMCGCTHLTGAQVRKYASAQCKKCKSLYVLVSPNKI